MFTVAEKVVTIILRCSVCGDNKTLEYSEDVDEDQVERDAKDDVCDECGNCVTYHIPLATIHLPTREGDDVVCKDYRWEWEVYAVMENLRYRQYQGWWVEWHRLNTDDWRKSIEPDVAGAPIEMAEVIN